MRSRGAANSAPELAKLDRYSVHIGDFARM